MHHDQQSLEGATMRITFKTYIDDLERAERRKAESERRAIPTMEEIAQVVNVHPVSFSRIVNNNVKRLNLDLVGRVIAFMRGRGFDMQTTDFLDYDNLERINT